MNENDREAEATREKMREYHRRWRAANPERARDSQRRYRKNHPLTEDHREANRVKARAYYAANRDRIRARDRATRDKSKHAQQERERKQRLGPNYMRDWHLRSKYGIRLRDYEAMVAERGGLCDICKRKPSGKRHHGVLHIDHSHATGVNRGLLCGRCNTAIGLLLEDVTLFESAVVYLRAHGHQDTRTPSMFGAS